MNYVSVVYAVVVVLMMTYWYVRGKRTFRRRDERHEAAVMEAERHMSIVH